MSMLAREAPNCGNKFRAEEMYICYNCNKIVCSKSNTGQEDEEYMRPMHRVSVLLCSTSQTLCEWDIPIYLSLLLLGN